MIGCQGSSGGSSGGPATNTETPTWPPQSVSETLNYLEGKTFKSTTLDDTIAISGGKLTFNGPTSSFHMATIFTSNTTNYQTPYNCQYTADELDIANFGEYLSSLKFNVLTSNDFEPGGILHCARPNCPSCDRLEYVSFSLHATEGCFEFDGQTFCRSE